MLKYIKKRLPLTETSPSVAVGMKVQEPAQVSGRLWQHGMMVAGGGEALVWGVGGGRGGGLHYKDLL